MDSRKILVVSDFNVEPFCRYLSNIPNLGIVVESSPYDQVYQTLSRPVDQPLFGGFIWTLPERVLPTFSLAMASEEIPPEECIKEVDSFADAVLHFAIGKRCVFVASWVLPPEFRGYGMLDWRPGVGTANLLARLNLRLSDRLSKSTNIFILDAQRWLYSACPAYSPKMWLAAKVPYAGKVLEQAAGDLAASLGALLGLSRRIILLDLDNTLWGGVIGETGWEGIRLGGHDHIGEAYREFQRGLISLANRGIQLAIISKNDESVALAAVDNHPEMVLRRDHFAGWRINWTDKAANIVSLLDELNLGIGSAVFIDDTASERERIRGALPDILVPEWPDDPCKYLTMLRSLDCFETTAISKEDRGRTVMYSSERQRRDIKKVVESQEEWLQRLNTKLHVHPLCRSNCSRVAQLFNKTNQLNLTTRRLSEEEILDWAKTKNRSVLAISASDCFGDLGLVGVLGVEADGETGHLIDFILSCRVMGRKIEEAMFYLAVSELARLGATRFIAHYVSTARNRPTLDVFRGFGLTESEKSVFTTDTIEGFSIPAFIHIENVNEYTKDAN